MTITVAVTGGIGAGKSTVAQRLAAHGAVVVDSDRLAREVVGLGTPGLAAVADRFGPGVIDADGSLDRPALAAIVFADAGARSQLEAITHPLVRERFAEARAAAPPGSVVVNDVPLLTSSDLAAAFHLVVGVGAPDELRMARLVRRGLTAPDALTRIAAQIDDDRRRPLCDVWLDNAAAPADLLAPTDRLWARLAEFAANVQADRPAARGAAVVVPYDPDWPAAARRLAARVRHAVGDRRIDHIGSTAVDGLPAEDVIELRLGVADLADAGRIAPLLTHAGFPPGGSMLHLNADPGRSVNLHLKVRY